MDHRMINQVDFDSKENTVVIDQTPVRSKSGIKEPTNFVSVNSSMITGMNSNHKVFNVTTL